MLRTAVLHRRLSSRRSAVSLCCSRRRRWPPRAAKRRAWCASWDLRGYWLFGGAYLTSAPPRKSTAARPDSAYFCDRIHFTRALMSASGTWVLGGIGTWPQTPWPPFLTLSTSFASAPGSLRYFAATSL